MALTSTQKSKIVQLLGYGGKVLQENSVIYNKTTADRLETLPEGTEELVVAYLDGIASIELQISEAPTRLIAKKVGDIELNNNELENLRSERKRMTRELSLLIDIPIVQGASGMMVPVIS